jgi:hypothetical protein
VRKFSVTFDTVTPESAEDGEVADGGFIVEDVSLREAVEAIGSYAPQPSCYPFDGGQHAWFSHDGYDEDHRTGKRESRSLHVPRDLTPSTRRRIARLLGVKL